MSIDVQICSSCTASWFPQRLICPRCGDSSFTMVPAEDGMVEEVTTLSDDVVIASVLTLTSVRVVARLLGAAPSGSSVPLSHDPTDVRRPVAHVPTPLPLEGNLHA